MVSQINVIPKVLDLALYAGDGVSLQLVFTDADRNPLDVTGTIRAQIRTNPTAADPAIVDFSTNLVDAYLGIVVISLTGAQTRDLSEHPSSNLGTFTGVWDVEWTAVDSQPRTLCKGKVECVSDVTR